MNVTQGFVAVWVLAALALMGALFGVWVPLLARQDRYAQERTGWLLAEAQAQCFLQKALLDIEAIDPKDISGTWKQEGREGIFYWNPSGKGRWLGYAETQDAELKTMPAGPTLSPSGFCGYTIKESQGDSRGLLWDPVAGEPKQPLAELLKTPEAEALTHVAHWKTLSPPTVKRPGRETPILIAARLEVNPLDADGQATLTLSLYNPFVHGFKGRLSIRASILFENETLRNALSLQKQKVFFSEKTFFFENHAALELGPGAILDVTLTGNGTPQLKCSASESTLSLTTRAGPRRDYSLEAPANAHPPDTRTRLCCWHLSPRNGPEPLLLRINLQPQKATLQACSNTQKGCFLKNLELSQRQKLLLDPLSHPLEHIGQLCRATPGYHGQDPTWRFGAPSPTDAEEKTMHPHTIDRKPIKKRTPWAPVHRIGAYSVWDHAFIDPASPHRSPYYVRPQHPNARLQIRDPLNVNSVSTEQWEKALDAPILRALFLKNPKDPAASIKTLAKTLSLSENGPWPSVLHYVESGAFQSALHSSGMGEVLQSSFLELLAPRLCVRSDSFEINTAGNAPSQGRTLQYRMKKRAQRLDTGRVMTSGR